MPVSVLLSQVVLLAPNARSSYRAALQNGQTVFDHFEISQTPLRVSHFMAQILHESGGLTVQFENLNYSPERLPKVWPTRFRPKGSLDPSDYAHNPEKLANEVYGGRMGNTVPGDGFKYRGRGLLQLTGKDSYAEATNILRRYLPSCPNFVVSPDEVINSNWCLAVAASEWAAKGCNAYADQDNIKKITRLINGGEIGMPDRIEWAKRTKSIWPQ